MSLTPEAVMARPIRICLVKRISDTSNALVDSLESIRFEDQDRFYRFPEENQPLTKHPVIAEHPLVGKILRTMKGVNQFRNVRIALPEEHRHFYVDDNGNFKFDGELLEECPDRSRYPTEEAQNGENVQNGGCSYKDIGCTFEGSPRALDTHLRIATDTHISLLAALVAKQKAEISSLRSALHESSGTLMWKISDYSNKLARAKSCAGSLYVLSEPFQTSTNGYKVRALLYLDGYGNGKGTHLSIFIQIIHGEYDSLLQWPFSRKVSFTLMDQPENPVEASHITRSFIPDQSSEIFKRPPETHDEVNGHGYPKFVSHETLATRHYIKNDTIFIKIEVGDSDPK